MGVGEGKYIDIGGVGECYSKMVGWFGQKVRDFLRVSKKSPAFVGRHRGLLH